MALPGMYGVPQGAFVPPNYHPLMGKRESPYTHEDPRAVKRQRRNSGDGNNDGGSSDEEEEEEDEDARLFAG